MRATPLAKIDELQLSPLPSHIVIQQIRRERLEVEI
jgi:hypothetical protein